MEGVNDVVEILKTSMGLNRAGIDRDEPTV